MKDEDNDRQGDNTESIEDEEPPKTTSDYKISLVSDNGTKSLTNPKDNNTNNQTIVI